MGEAKRRKKRQAEAANRKGVFSQYLNRRLRGKELTKERRRQLQRISALRSRPNIVMAAGPNKGPNVSTTINYEDILPFQDLLEGLDGKSIDVLVETLGGSAEVVEDLVKLLRGRFEEVAFIVPGWAKSAGTILVMAGDEIVMGPGSALGPIDAQMSWKNKVFSADAFLQGLEEMKKEANDQGLNKAHIPILQQISPGEIQRARNALKFARDLVGKWLEKYKFHDWTVHTSSNAPVTIEERRETAHRIAKDLCDHQRWLTHGRSIKIQDLRDLGLKITDFSTNRELNDAIRRYRALLQMTFESNMYKLFETEYGMIGRFANVNPAVQDTIRKGAKKHNILNVDTKCSSCKKDIPLQFRFADGIPPQKGRIPYPKDDTVTCPHCGRQANIAALRDRIERDSEKEVIPW